MAKKDPSLSQLIAAFCHKLEFSGIPAEVVQAAKDHTLDALGIGLAAASMGFASNLEKAIRSLGSGEESTGIGFTHRFPPSSAALLNGLLIHSLEFDDTHIPSVIHGSSVVVPACLAIAESEGVSGRDFIRAIVLGWEVLIRLGLAAQGSFQANGFQGTAVCGPFAAAATSSVLLNLGMDKTIHAMGIAGSQSSGIFEFLSDGATVKSFHPGWAAHAGVVAGYLARGGMTGPTSILEGRFGLYNTYARTSLAADQLRELLNGLGEAWYLPEVAIKVYPCCHYIHSFLECLQNLMEDGLSVGEVESIQCFVPVEEVPIICEPWERKLQPISGYEAKFSLPYCLASLLVDHILNVSTFDREFPDEKVLSVAKKLSFKPLAGAGFPERFSGSLEVFLTSGQILSASVADVRGSQTRLLSSEEIRRKFTLNARRRLTADTVATIMAEFDLLEDAPHMKPLSKALRSVASEPPAETS